LACEAAADNQSCAEFIDEILEWVPKAFDLPIKPRPMKAFQSKLEIVSDKDIQSTFDKFSQVGSLIASLLTSYGLTAAPYNVAGFAMQYEPQKDAMGNPDFEFARRKGQSYEAGIYYSSAPLRTKDHLLVLEMVEGLL
jgi:hypothetical protein